jgi:hypothetical protein
LLELSHFQRTVKLRGLVKKHIVCWIFA